MRHIKDSKTKSSNDKISFCSSYCLPLTFFLIDSSTYVSNNVCGLHIKDLKHLPGFQQSPNLNSDFNSLPDKCYWGVLKFKPNIYKFFNLQRNEVWNCTQMEFFLVWVTSSTPQIIYTESQNPKIIHMSLC